MVEEEWQNIGWLKIEFWPNESIRGECRETLMSICLPVLELNMLTLLSSEVIGFIPLTIDTASTWKH